MFDTVSGARPWLMSLCVAVSIGCGVAPIADPDLDAAALDSQRAEGTVGPIVLVAQPYDTSVVQPDVIIKILFSASMDTAATTAAFLVADKMNNRVAGRLSWDVRGAVLAFRPNDLLPVGAYQVAVDETATDEDGVPIAEPYLISFVVTDAPAESKVPDGASP